jgi:hypothetical protein
MLFGSESSVDRYQVRRQLKHAEGGLTVDELCVVRQGVRVPSSDVECTLLDMERHGEIERFSSRVTDDGLVDVWYWIPAYWRQETVYPNPMYL